MRLWKFLIIFLLAFLYIPTSVADQWKVIGRCTSKKVAFSITKMYEDNAIAGRSAMYDSLHEGTCIPHALTIRSASEIQRLLLRPLHEGGVILVFHVPNARWYRFLIVASNIEVG